MRTTLTLDEDVAAKLRAETRRSGRSFKEAVNEFLRIGLNSRRPAKPPARFRIRARSLGRLKPGLSLDNVSALLEEAEGPVHR
ncbi:DUF2191 domain-containing protein [Candidatus Binatia bacterium]|nr:DUF2191 domain-containing protein [Candidatus Binatia bacterium]